MRDESRQSLLISSETPEVRIAHVRDGRLSDLFIERGGWALNNICKGRIANVIKGMDAAFIDIGLARNALIYAGDIVDDVMMRPVTAIDKVVKVGDELTVQIVRPPVGAKGARVTTRLSLAGRYIVLSTHEENAGVSRRIESEEERSRLRRLADKLRPLDHGLILRTEAEGASESELSKDVQSVASLMGQIRQSAKAAPAPSLVHREAGLIGRVVRDRLNESIHEVLIDTPDEFESFMALARVLVPHLCERIHLYQGQSPLFQQYEIENDIAKAQQHSVELKSGGTLVIDEAEALCVIDVNTGKFTGKTRLADTVVQTNIEAVEEAARQIRLRNLSGVIVIDFIDMERHKDRIRVLDTLEAALQLDHSRTRIVQLSPSGLVEITRRRESHSLRQVVKRPCIYCEGAGVIKSPASVAIEARRKVRQIADHKNAETKANQEKPLLEILPPMIAVTLHPEVACAFLGATNEYVDGLEKSAHARVWLRVDPNFHMEASAIEWVAEENLQILSATPFEENQTGGKHSFDAGNIKPEMQITLPIGGPLFPSKEPHFAVFQNRLIHLENVKEIENSSDKKTEVLVTAFGRWHAVGRVLQVTQVS